MQAGFHANQRVIVESLAAQKALRPGLDGDRAADILWTLNHPLYGSASCVNAAGPDDWEHWFADTSWAQLLR